MAAAFEHIGKYLWTFSWDIGILILLIAGLEHLLRRRSSLFRYLLWMIVLLRLAVPVTITLPIPKPTWFERVQTSVPVMRAVEMTAPQYERERFDPQPVAAPMIAMESVSVPEPLLPPLSIAARAGIIWGACVVMIMLLIAARWLHISYTLRRTISLRYNGMQRILENLYVLIGLRRKVSLHAWDAETNGTVSLAGVIHPRIVIPQKMADTWPTDDVSPILLHELAHVKRADLAVNWLQVILQSLYFFHPLVWFANHRIRRLREEACDDLAVAALNGSRKQYVESMLRIMEETTRTPMFGFAAMGFAERRSNIGERIRRIMDTRTRFSSRLTKKSIVAIAVIAATATLLSCGVTSVWRVGSVEPALTEIPDELIIGEDLTQDQMDVIKKAIASDDLAIHITVAAILTTDDEKNETLLGAVNNVVRAVNRYTGITATVQQLSLDDPALLSCHVAFMLDAPSEGNESVAEEVNLREYFSNGGFLYGEWSDFDEQFTQNEARVKQLLQYVLGFGAHFLPIADNDMLYHSFFDFEDGAPTGTIAADGTIMNQTQILEGITLDDNLAVVVSDKGYMNRWNESAAEPLLRFGTNLVVYAAFHEGGMLAREAHNDPVTVIPPPSGEIISTSDAHRSVSKPRPELHAIEVIDDDSYLINGDTISKEDLESVLQGFNLIDKDGAFTLKYNEQNKSASDYFMNTVRRLAEYQISEAIEIDVIDDATYRIRGERVSRGSLKDVFRQGNDLVDVSAEKTIIRYYPAADIEAADYAVEVAESFGVTNIQMSVEMDVTKDVLIQPYNESYFKISWWQQTSELIPDILRELKDAGKKIYVLHETNKFIPPYEKSLEESYEQSFRYLVSQLKVVDVDYQVLEMKYWSDSAQQSGAGFTSPGVSEIINNARNGKYRSDWGLDLKPERLKLNIEILDEATYRVFGRDVSRDDLEQVLKENMDPDLSYCIVTGGRQDVPAETYIHVNDIGRKLGITRFASDEWNGEETGKKLPPIITNMPDGEKTDLVIEIVDDHTYHVFEQNVPKDDLERLLRVYIDPSVPYNYVVKGMTDQPMIMFNHASTVAAHLGFETFDTHMKKPSVDDQ